MELKAMELSRSAFSATGLAPCTFACPQEADSDPVDTVAPSGGGAEAAPAQAPDVRVRYNPQDGMVMPAVETTVPRADIGTDMSNPRMRMADEGTPESPDAEGNYLFAPGSRGYQQSQSFTSTSKTLRLFEHALGHDIDWAFSGKLSIHPHAGNDFNAYYSRSDKSTNFFDGDDPKAGRTMYSCESLDVVSHETGHAILDGMKPGLLGWFSSTEGEAFHESFGDVAAMLTALQDDAVLDRLVEQTSGELHRDNFVAHLAEELSQGINDTIFDGQKPAGWTIRNANNALRYQDPKNLPSNPRDETQLGKEAHNFSRLFTGAMWDLTAELTAQGMAEGKSTKEAIVAARDVMLPLYARMVELGPNRMKKYRQMADSMVEADTRDNGGKHLDTIKKVFADRDIRPLNAADATAPPAITLERPILNDADAVDFLADHRHELGVPGDVPLRPEARWTNNRGETFVRYDYTKEERVRPGLATDLSGSLTVAFDRDGNLFHSLWEPVDEEQIALAKDAIEFHESRGEIRGAGDPFKATNADGHPYAGFIAVGADGDRKVVRIPTVS